MFVFNSAKIMILNLTKLSSWILELKPDIVIPQNRGTVRNPSPHMAMSKIFDLGQLDHVSKMTMFSNVYEPHMSGKIMHVSHNSHIENKFMFPTPIKIHNDFKPHKTSILNLGVDNIHSCSKQGTISTPSFPNLFMKGLL